MSATRTFLVEAYAPAASEVDRVSAQARLAVSAGPPIVRHIRSILVPEDELCLHLFEADSAAVLAVAVGGAAMTAPRIVEVTLVSGEGDES